MEIGEKIRICRYLCEMKILLSSCLDRQKLGRASTDTMGRCGEPGTIDILYRANPRHYRSCLVSARVVFYSRASCCSSSMPYLEFYMWRHRGYDLFSYFKEY